MAWVRESKDNPITGLIGTVTTWNGTEFEWDDLTGAKWKEIWARESRPAAGWAREA